MTIFRKGSLIFGKRLPLHFATGLILPLLMSNTVDNQHTVWIGGMVPFWARIPCASMQTSMDKSRESSDNPP